MQLHVQSTFDRILSKTFLCFWELTRLLILLMGHWLAASLEHHHGNKQHAPAFHNAHRQPCIISSSSHALVLEQGAAFTAAPTDAMSKTGETSLNCDYLVIGAGTACMAFVDTLLSENTSATVILVDRNATAGGHWNHAYPYVRLHQPSCYYGVNSLKLGKNRNRAGNEIYDVNDRATGAEILEYFQTVCDNFVATGRVRCYFGAEYESEQMKTETIHWIVGRNDTGLEKLQVNCRKLVTVSTNVTAPSMRKPLVPVDETVHFVPLNKIPSCAKSGKYTNYIVCGNGKSGIDAIVELVREQRVDPSQITWILGRDIWMIFREQLQDYFGTIRMVLKELEHWSSLAECYLAWEAAGLCGRLDGPNRPKVPGWFKGTIVDQSEFQLIRSVKTLIRRGRASSINAGRIVFQDDNQPPLEFDPEKTLVVDCMVNDFYGYQIPKDFRIFETGKINLGPAMAFFNISLTSAMIAFLESNIRDVDGNFDEEKVETRKNNCCYILRCRHSRPNPEVFLGAYYMNMKTYQTFMKLEGGMKFIMSSRLNDGASIHQKGGLWRLMWEFYGPKKLHKAEAIIIDKVESKRFSDVDHCFGVESLVKVEGPKPEKESRRGTRFLRKCFRRRSGKNRTRKDESFSTF